MRKNKTGKNKTGKDKKLLVPALVFLLVLLPARAFAGCETPFSASPAMAQLAKEDTKTINDFIEQEKKFIDKDLTQTATYEMMSRLDEFDVNLLAWLNDWWKNRLLPSMKQMTKQLSAAQIDQTRTAGALMDAQLFSESASNKKQRQSEAHLRYRPSDMACQADTVSLGQTKAQQLSKAITRATAMDDAKRRGNDRGSISAAGRGAEMSSLWTEYVAHFCDNENGDKGCTQPGTMPGKHKDIPAMLWGDKQTIDLSNPENLIMMQAALHYLVYPLSSDPIPPGAVESADGHQAILVRRAESARTNAIYNVIGQMVGERVGGSGVNVQAIRAAAGIPVADASANASYREAQQALTKDRFNSPEYIVRMVNDPEQVVREQMTISAIRLQILNDIYRRSEELLFLSAAEYSRDLDKQIPSSAVSSAPLKQ
jgi:hypothetical protein